MVVVQVAHCCHYLIKVVAGISLGESFFLNNPIEELSSAAELGYDVEFATVLVDFENLEDAGVVLHQTGCTSFLRMVYSLRYSLARESVSFFLRTTLIAR